ncbi:uncharacterized protein MKK02DRAFT_26867 [Dioszegia hungarica]|uniref:MaoC-like domain-containing protein n=1 Tax=Dioszegia hungarica TaxID=4972 RepID=A0AA38H837_9TREE|nr:uncharacterized protein MKK02DRAFT_26867 [Dioszegia hungarica]KAI9636085.1 hypothetical protein MKK02DRAFT_26867 [Dioszegia hungarica]
MGLLGLKHLGLGPKLGKVRSDGTVLLPSLSVSAPLLISEADVQAYHRAVKADNTAAPLFLLAPLAAPLVPSLMLLAANPIKPLGAVNVRNTFVFHRPDLQSGRKEDGKDLRAEAKMGGEKMLGRRMKRGVEYDTLIEVFEAGDTASPGQKRPIFSFTFTTLSLVRLPSSAPLYAGAVASASMEPAWYDDPTPLSLPTSSTPLGWASLSKDYNPIHVSPFLARLFGFKRNIAHGNLIVGIVMDRATSVPRADKGNRARAALGRLWSSDQMKPSWLVVEFKRPVFVPSSPKVRWSEGGVQVFEEAGLGRGKKAPGQAESEIRVLVDIRAGEGVNVPAV